MVYCNQVKAQHGLTMPVLIDDGTIMSTLGITSANHWNIVFGEGGEIVYKAKGDDAPLKIGPKCLGILAIAALICAWATMYVSCDA